METSMKTSKKILFSAFIQTMSIPIVFFLLWPLIGGLVVFIQSQNTFSTISGSVLFIVSALLIHLTIRYRKISIKNNTHKIIELAYLTSSDSNIPINNQIIDASGLSLLNLNASIKKGFYIEEGNKEPFIFDYSNVKEFSIERGKIELITTLDNKPLITIHPNSKDFKLHEAYLVGNFN